MELGSKEQHNILKNTIALIADLNESEQRLKLEHTVITATEKLAQKEARLEELMKPENKHNNLINKR